MSERSLKQIFEQTKAGDLGVIGDPVTHSLSPLMQNAALKTWAKTFRDRNKPLSVYHKFPVPVAQLEEAIQLAKQHQLLGLNVTVPHKVSVCQWVDWMDPFAKKVGAVNTLVFTDGLIKGFNTDGDGFRVALDRDLNFEIEKKQALVLGAGGTGRVLVQTLVDHGAHVFWWNRNQSKLKAQLDERDELKTHITVVESEKEINTALSQAHLIVNSTSVGLSPQDGLPLASLKFRPGQYAFDVIYNRETRFIQEARAAGASATGGVGMLVYQGSRSFELWTDVVAPKEIMWNALTQSLKKE